MKEIWIILTVFGVLALIAAIMALVAFLRQRNKKIINSDKTQKGGRGDGVSYKKSAGDSIEKERSRELKKYNDKQEGYDFYEEMKKNTPNPIKDLIKNEDSFIAKFGSKVGAEAANSLMAALKRRSGVRMSSPNKSSNFQTDDSTKSVESFSKRGTVGNLRTPQDSRVVSHAGGGSESGVGGDRRNGTVGGSGVSGLDMKYEAYKSLRDQSLSMHAFLRGKGAWWEAFEDIAILAAARDCLQKLNTALETFRSDEPPEWREARERVMREEWAREKLAKKYGINPNEVNFEGRDFLK